MNKTMIRHVSLHMPGLPRRPPPLPADREGLPCGVRDGMRGWGGRARKKACFWFLNSIEDATPHAVVRSRDAMPTDSSCTRCVAISLPRSLAPSLETLLDRHARASSCVVFYAVDLAAQKSNNLSLCHPSGSVGEQCHSLQQRGSHHHHLFYSVVLLM